MNEEFEEWKTWFDSHKEPDGTINLSKHPDLVHYLENMYMPSADKFKNTPNNLGATVNFERVIKLKTIEIPIWQYWMMFVLSVATLPSWMWLLVKVIEG